MTTTISYRLAPSERENRFRQTSLKRDCAVAQTLLLIAVFFQIVSFPTDRMLIETSNALYVAWGIRLVSAIIAGSTFIIVRRAREVATFDNVIFVWSSLLVLGIVTANAMFPANYSTHVAWDLLLALAAYAVLPLPLLRQMAVAFIISAGDMVLFWQYKILENPGALIDIFTAFICANMVGIFTSWELHRWRRQQFQTLQREAEAKRALEEAMLEIKSLRGIIPICASCKKMRTDEGHWKQVEAYLKDHSNVDFTHGVCPECERRLYPEMFHQDPADADS